MKKFLKNIFMISIMIMEITGCSLLPKGNDSISSATNNETATQEKINKNDSTKNPAEEKNIKYKITFDSQGGTSVASQAVDNNNRVIKPENPVKEGYTFVEWQLNGQTYDFNSIVKSNITLTAVWEEKNIKYKITFDSQGGTSVASQAVDNNNRVIKPENPVKEGYTFVEWQLNGQTYDFNSIVKSNITLTAVWKGKQYSAPLKPTISWRGGGGPTYEEAELFLKDSTGIIGWELYLVSNEKKIYIDTYSPSAYSKLFRVENDQTMSFVARTYIINDNKKIYSDYSDVFILKNDMWN